MHEDRRRGDLEQARRFATRLVPDSGWAEDLAQDAWLELSRRPPGRRDRLRSWLRQVMRRRASDQHRCRRRGGELESEVARSELADSTLDVVVRTEVRERLVEEVLDASTVRGRLQRALRRLELQLGSRESWLPTVLPLLPELSPRSPRRAGRGPGELRPTALASGTGGGLASTVGVCA